MAVLFCQIKCEGTMLDDDTCSHLKLTHTHTPLTCIHTPHTHTTHTNTFIPHTCICTHDSQRHNYTLLFNMLCPLRVPSTHHFSWPPPSASSDTAQPYRTCPAHRDTPQPYDMLSPSPAGPQTPHREPAHTGGAPEPSHSHLSNRTPG